MPRYSLTALYSYTPLERTVVMEADNVELAMMRALMEGQVPAAFLPDEYGWLIPVNWHAQLAGARRWPVFVSECVVAWGDEPRQQVSFYVTEVAQQSSAQVRD